MESGPALTATDKSAGLHCRSGFTPRFRNQRFALDQLVAAGRIAVFERTGTLDAENPDVETWEPHFTFHGFQFVEVTVELTASPLQRLSSNR